MAKLPSQRSSQHHPIYAVRQTVQPEEFKLSALLSPVLPTRAAQGERELACLARQGTAGLGRARQGSQPFLKAGQPPTSKWTLGRRIWQG